MVWTIDFISKEDFKKHVKNTIKHYGNKLASYDVKKFNRNLIDPIKMIFDKAVYGENWETIIACLLYTSPSPRDLSTSRMPSSA